jgi:competence protein ComEC
MLRADVFVLNNHGKSESNVVWFPHSRLALVVDCGSNGKLTVDCLRRLGPDKVRVVLTHLEKDHCGGAKRVLAEFEKTIEAIYFKTDRADALKVPAVNFILDRADAKKLPTPRTLQMDGRPKRLHLEEFQGEKAGAWLLSPNVLETAKALHAEDPNRAGAIIRIAVGGFSLLMGDDVPLPVWESLPPAWLKSQGFIIPHHGAPAGATAKYGLEQLAKAVAPKFALISVGTTNGYKHPHPEAVKAFQKVNAKVICTQITEHCLPLTAGDRHVITPTDSLDFPGPGSNCMGTISLRIESAGITVSRLHQHTDALIARAPSRKCQ